MKNTIHWLMCIFVMILIIKTIPKIEGYLYPVVTEFQFIQNENSTISGSFMKQRKCNFEQLDWYINNKKVKVMMLDVPVVREIGTQVFSNWFIYNQANITALSKIYVVHECNPFWNTITKIY